MALLCGLAEGTALERSREGLNAVKLAGALAVTALTVSDMTAMIGLGRETIGRMDAFAGLLLPAMAALTAATGGVTGAAVRQGVTVLCSDLLISAIDRLLVPLLYAYAAACCAHAALGNGGLGKLAELIQGGGHLPAHHGPADFCGLSHRQRGHRRFGGRGGGQGGQADHLPGGPGGGGHPL